jgi:hypothetical protein
MSMQVPEINEMGPDTKCGNPDCDCFCKTEEDYCCEYCRIKAPVGPEERCECGHPECSGPVS